MIIYILNILYIGNKKVRILTDVWIVMNESFQLSKLNYLTGSILSSYVQVTSYICILSLCSSYVCYVY